MTPTEQRDIPDCTASCSTYKAGGRRKKKEEVAFGVMEFVFPSHHCPSEGLRSPLGYQPLLPSMKGAYENVVRDNVKSLAAVEVDNIHCSPLIHQSSCFIIEDNQGLFPWDSSKKIPEEAKISSPEVFGSSLITALLPPCLVLNSTISWSLQSRLPPTFTCPTTLNAAHKVQIHHPFLNETSVPVADSHEASAGTDYQLRKCMDYLSKDSCIAGLVVSPPRILPTPRPDEKECWRDSTDAVPVLLSSSQNTFLATSAKNNSTVRTPTGKLSPSQPDPIHQVMSTILHFGLHISSGDVYFGRYLMPSLTQSSTEKTGYSQGNWSSELVDRDGEQNRPPSNPRGSSYLLYHLDTQKSMGPDGIHPRELWHLVEELTKPLSIIYHHS
ncbi:hypothetical protein BTVI_43903 [Pitangus sulphuratus]|nr:hypothetical protein BTVI_43903 [Pitangus sulphuratus]